MTVQLYEIPLNGCLFEIRSKPEQKLSFSKLGHEVELLFKNPNVTPFERITTVVL